MRAFSKLLILTGDKNNETTILPVDFVLDVLV